MGEVLIQTINYKSLARLYFRARDYCLCKALCLGDVGREDTFVDELMSVDLPVNILRV